MPRVSDFKICYLNEQPALVIDAVIKADDVPTLVNDSYDEIQEYLQLHQEYLTDAPFVAYHNGDLEKLEVEIGFPTRVPVVGNKRVRFSTFPAGKYVVCMHLGPRNDLKKVYEEMQTWYKENNVEPAGINMYECYYGSKSQISDDSKLVTKVAVLLK